MIAIANKTSESECLECHSRFAYKPVFDRHGVEAVQCIPQRCNSCRRGAPKMGQVCVQCKSVFDGRRRKYCSRECRESVRAIPIRKAVLTATCQGCGIDFETDRKGRKWCSADCKGKTQDLTCEQCDKSFRGRGGQLTCGHSCKIARRKKLVRQRVEGFMLSGNANTFIASQVTGIEGEMLFDIWCLRSSIEVARPVLENNPRWDRIIRLDEQWVTVQIKSSAALMILTEQTNSPIHPTVDMVARVNISNGEVVLIENKLHT